MGSIAAAVQKCVLPSDQDATGRTLGEPEIEALTQCIRSGVLTSTKGTFVRSFEKQYAAQLGSRSASALSSGTAAIHAAVAAVNPEPGDEIITTAITDMGALTPILYQGAIPVFADVDPQTCNLTAEAIEAKLSDRTRAIMVTHLFGNPCNMGPILELASSRNIPVIEDCAQAFLATWNGRNVGTLGALGCFSLQQGKHITTGEGGICVSDDEDLARRVFLFLNKAWGYGDASPDHYFIALNYRMSELQGAVALAQLDQLKGSVERRQQAAADLTSRIEGLPGVTPPVVHPSATNVFWKYAVQIDRSILRGGAPAFAQILREQFNIASAPRYIQKPAFRCQIFRDQVTFGSSRFPFTLARPEAVDYSTDAYPGTFEALERVLVLPWNEQYTSEHVAYIASAMQTAAEALR